MFSFAQAFVIAAAISAAYGANYDMKISPENYYLISQQELLHDIALVNAQIAGVKAHIFDRIVIEYENEQLLNEIDAVNQAYFPLEDLSAPRKYCVQKYSDRFITHNGAAGGQANCYNIKFMATSYTGQAKQKTVNAHRSATTSLSDHIADCDKSYTGGSEGLLEKCYIDSVTRVSEYIDEQLADAKDLLTKALRDSTEFRKSAMNCSFELKTNVLESNFQASKLIQTCEACVERRNSTAEC